MLTFYNLKKLGILTEQDSGQGSTPLNKVTSGVASMAKRSSHKSLCRKLNLVSQGGIGLDSGQGSTPLDKVTSLGSTSLIKVTIR